MSYHAFEAEGEAYGSFEVFKALGENDAGMEPGKWYWWACFPGCLPDGEAYGPFETEEEAIADAQEA